MARSTMGSRKGRKAPTGIVATPRPDRPPARPMASPAASPRCAAQALPPRRDGGRARFAYFIWTVPLTVAVTVPLPASTGRGAASAAAMAVMRR